MAGVLVADQALVASGQVAGDPTTITLSPVIPTPSPLGTWATYTMTVHIDDDFPDGTHTIKASTYFSTAGGTGIGLPTGVHFDDIVGQGYPGEACSSPGLYTESAYCNADASRGDPDFVFTVPLEIRNAAVVGSSHLLRGSLQILSSGRDPVSSNLTPFEVSAAAPPTTTSITAAPTSTTAAPTTTEDTLPATGPSEDLERTGAFGIALLLLGIVTLSGAAVIGQYRRQ